MGASQSTRYIILLIRMLTEGADMPGVAQSRAIHESV